MHRGRCIHVGGWVCMQVCGGQGTSLGVFPQGLPTFFSETWSLTHLALSKSQGFACVYWPTMLRVQACAPLPTFVFYMGYSGSHSGSLSRHTSMLLTHLPQPLLLAFLIHFNLTHYVTDDFWLKKKRSFSWWRHEVLNCLKTYKKDYKNTGISSFKH